MKLETLEKLIELIRFRTESPSSYNDIADIENELRSLVKAESEPEGGDATMIDTSPGHLNPPPDVQAEGRGDLGLNDALRIARGCLDYGGGYRSDRAHLEIYHHGIQTVINALEGAVKIGLKDSQCAALWRMGLETSKPHNPDNLQSPGDGYRFLDEDEVTEGPSLEEIEWFKPKVNRWVPGNFGSNPECIYRTRLTREELAKKRKEGM